MWGVGMSWKASLRRCIYVELERMSRNEVANGSGRAVQRHRGLPTMEIKNLEPRTKGCV